MTSYQSRTSTIKCFHITVLYGCLLPDLIELNNFNKAEVKLEQVVVRRRGRSSNTVLRKACLALNCSLMSSWLPMYDWRA